MATSAVSGNKYRSYLSPEELKNTKWINGPPNYDDVDKLFEEGRTKIWGGGSLEEKVQNLVKTWEMELVHKADPNEYKTLDAKNFTLGINGKKYYSLEEVGKAGGGYNVFLHTSLPAEFRVYNPDEETYTSSQTAFKQIFSRGFALEILQVYSGAPSICYEFRHWGYMEAPFQGNPPTGQLIEFFGMAIFQLDENDKVVKVAFFFDRGELLAELIKGNKTSADASSASASACPFMAWLNK